MRRKDAQIWDVLLRLAKHLPHELGDFVSGKQNESVALWGLYVERPDLLYPGQDRVKILG